jgi:5-methyltetrahydrofolate corrinoid/iron sulfur protein methyltransferase
MFIIGERLNGMFKEVKNAIENRDEGPIQDLATQQVKAGADALDLNVGPTRGGDIENMIWLVETVQEVTDTTLCVDTAKEEVMVEALQACENPTIINSTKAIEKQLETYVGMATEHGSGLIALTINESGVPSDVNARVQMGATIASKAMEGALPMEDLYIDPVILPVNVAPKQPARVMEALGQLKMLSDPSPHFMLGLSNVSQGCKERSLLNRIYASMAIGAGLSALLMDALDEDLMNAVITAEVLMERQLYCDDYISAYMGNR